MKEIYNHMVSILVGEIFNTPDERIDEIRWTSYPGENYKDVVYLIIPISEKIGRFIFYNVRWPLWDYVKIFNFWDDGELMWSLSIKLKKF